LSREFFKFFFDISLIFLFFSALSILIPVLAKMGVGYLSKLLLCTGGECEQECACPGDGVEPTVRFELTTC
jgi:hypothetical protein